VSETVPVVIADAGKRIGFRTGIMALAKKSGLDAADQQKAGSAVGSEMMKRVAGPQIEECISQWKDPTATKAFAVAVAAMDGKTDTKSWTQAVDSDLKTKVYADEPNRDVHGDACAAFNNPRCFSLALE